MRMSRGLSLGLVVALVTAAGCASKAPAVTAPVSPQYPDFLFPRPSAGTPPAVIEGHQQAWWRLQSGDLRAAERAWDGLLRRDSRSGALLAGLGYVALARQDAQTALDRFDDAVAADPALASAQVGRGQALVALDQPAEAIGAFEAATRADPTLDFSARIEALRFRGTQQAVGRARAAAEAGQWEKAREAYLLALQASPDSAFLLRELASVERRAGRDEEALGHVERAIELDPADRSAYVTLGELREAAGDVEGAIRAYEAARALEPGGAVDERLASLRERVELAGLPEAYRSIGERATVTRGDVAALLGIQLGDLLEGAPESAAPVVTDVRQHWASSWILEVMRAGVIQPFPNHTFQPDLPMARGDFAQAMARALNLIVAQQPTLRPTWQSARREFPDLSTVHPAYPAASMTVAAGIMHPSESGAFEAARPVSGQEAIDALGRLRRLAGPARRGASR